MEPNNKVRYDIARQEACEIKFKGKTVFFYETVFGLVGVEQGRDDDYVRCMTAEEAELETQIEEAENHDAITLTDDDEEDENHVEALEYSVLFAFFFTAISRPKPYQNAFYAKKPSSPTSS